ncbi:DUF4112 domain-containing protein [Aliifodinibius sp. S!AR15-10]|uniref:DUF4112 domain-containing protein n=1 Tax=Aliifodinibius sp. S!AR15-10 TaxID=2950437 RepID=UPI00286773C8|nr:DUF4112 domain-containing protein [Aliifodinibius sp. S!AR15-10]MDR8394048.1 DUF4112 domain-containing protein [Aliifodinibius sp. S!AR15-10]
MYSKKEKSRSQQLADILDQKFSIPGSDIKFGIDPILGLLPGIGDWVGGVLSLYFPIHAVMLGARVSILLRMFLYILVDIIIGALPLLGEIFDVAWKANLRNAELLEQLQQNPDELATESKILLWGLLILFITVILGFLWLIGWILAQIVGALL